MNKYFTTYMLHRFFTYQNFIAQNFISVFNQIESFRINNLKKLGK